MLPVVTMCGRRTAGTVNCSPLSYICSQHVLVLMEGGWMMLIILWLLRCC